MVLLIGHDALETCFNQSEELPDLVIDASSENFLLSFLRRHFAGKSCSVGVANEISAFFSGYVIWYRSSIFVLYSDRQYRLSLK